MRALAILLVPALATAAPKYATVVAGDEGPVRTAVQKARPKLDRCWRTTTRFTLRLAVEKGAVKAVERVDGDERGPLACVTKVLRSVKIAERPTGTFELQVSSLDLDAIAANVGRQITTLDKPTADADRSRADIDRVIRARATALRKCYQQQLERRPALAGKVIIRFEITPDGGVTEATVTSTTMNDATVERCLVKEVRGLTFPAASAPSTVTYPFVFVQGG